MLSRIGLAALLALTLTTAVPGPAAAATVQVWTATSDDNVFQDATRPANFLTSHRYVVARNEYESFQILTRSTGSFTINGVDFTNLTSGGNSIAAANLSYNFVEYSFSGENTPGFGAVPPAVRLAPANFPDALSNEPTKAVGANTTQPIWVTLYVPKTANPGMYTGSATVHTTSGDLVVAIQAEVANVTIPDANTGSFTTMNHQQIAGTWASDATATSHPNDVIVRLYGFERWTAQWWALVDDMIAQLRKHRVNSVWVNTQQLLLDGGTTMSGSTYTFQWGRFDEYIQRFMDAGFVKQLEASHFGSTTTVVGVSYTTYLLKNVNGTMQSTHAEALSPDSNNWLEQFVPALYQHLVAKGWLGMWYQHIGDEMDSDLQRQQYANYMSYINTYAPGMRAGDPTFNVLTADYALSQGTKVTIPSLDTYEDNKAVFDNHLRNGKEVFVYNMCCVGADNLNRFVDGPVWHGRNLGWVLYKYGLPGYLHWAWNFWVDWNQTVFHTIDDEIYKGDHYSVYPDIPRNRIKSTIRFEATRDMAEDYELLNLAGREHQQAVRTMIDSVASEFDTYSFDKANMRDKRAELVRLAASPAGRLFTNPVGNLANPNVVKVGSTYHLAASDGNRIYVKSSGSLEAVAAAPPRYVWSNLGAGMTFSPNLWVSDLRYLDGRWYLYFTGDTGSGQRTHVLEGGTDAGDPLNGTYTYKARLADQAADLFALSGTVLVHNGAKYFVWSGIPNAGATTQYLYAAPMSNPWTLSGPRSEIAGPDQGWEAGVLDAPEVASSGGVTRILYSANNAGSAASQLGALTLTGSDPLAKPSWTKTAYPVLATGDGVFGPGFPAVTTSPDGTQDWLMYHARRSSESTWDRTTRLQRLLWQSDGTLGAPYGSGQAHAVPSGTPAVTGVYEAEQGTRTGSALVGYESEASRKLVVFGIDTVGSSVSMNVTAATAGEYLLTVRNATGWAGARHNVYVNGTNLGKLNYPNLGWNRFSTVGMLVNLNAGANTVKFQKDSPDDQYAEIDYIAIGDRLEAEEGVLSGAGTVYFHDPQASGAAAAAGIDTASSAVELYLNVPTAGLYSLETMNSTGYSPASHLLFVNGTPTWGVNYFNNGWSNFSTPATNVVALNAGNNVIKYMKGTNHADIDFVRLHKIGTKYEAEDATLANGASVGNESTASGGKVAWAIDSVGPPPSSATFTVTVPTAGTYTVDIRAASGWPLPDHVLSVNGTTIGPITYPAVGWNQFTTTTVRLRLNAGANTLTFAKGAGAGSNTAELDFIEVRP